MTDEHVIVRLSKVEALVLFEFLTRFSNHERLKVEDAAEETALWNLQCLLEKELAEPFNSDYEEILREAKRQLRETEGATSAGAESL